MKTRTVLLLGVAIICGLVTWWIVWKATSAVAVDAAAAKVGPISEFVDERGMTRLPETYLITMPEAGRIEAVSLAEGSAVEQGQVVARIVPRDLDLVVRQATAAVDRLKASIAENADDTVEETGYKQTLQFLESMRQTVKAAAARVEAGRAKFDYAERDLGRTQKLAEAGNRTQDELEKTIVRKVQAAVDYQQDMLVHAAMIALEAATDLMPTMVRQYIDRKNLTEAVLEKEKAEAEVRLERALQDQQRGTMRSPVDGVVLKRCISNERFLAAGETLLEVGRIEDLEVEADILSLDVVKAKRGDRVKIYGPAIGKPPAAGYVQSIYPAGFTKISSLGVEQQRVKVIIHFDPNDLDRLRKQRNLGVGYRVRVQITTAEKPAALVIPRSALFRSTKGDWQVFAIRRGRAKVTTVEVGLLNDKDAEILEGLAEGDRVILAPESNLTDGARVTEQTKPVAL